MLGESRRKWGRRNMKQMRKDDGSYSEWRGNGSRVIGRWIGKRGVLLGHIKGVSDVIKSFWKGGGWRSLKNKSFPMRSGDRCLSSR